ncbi:MAG: hypothetical protein P9L94_10430 [Candidatus Hinthialibacter antarcticus]|nr:hypothetical protein [Candidatus Hinthialibacter antarcticus]
MPTKLCGYVSPFDGYKCDTPAYQGSEDGLCIGHTFEIKKSKKAFQSLIIQKFKDNDFNFDGFVFPAKFFIKNIRFEGTVSFIGCTFQKGLHFEKVKFLSDQVRFDQCWFEKKDVFFDRCIFNSPRIVFNDSALTSDTIEFRNCGFFGEKLEFDRVQWKADKHIAFLACQFRSQSSMFDKAILKAPVISFFGSSFHGDQFDFYRTSFETNKLTFKRIKSIKGKINFNETRVRSNVFDLSESMWHDKGMRWQKVNWSGDRLLFNDLKSVGAKISMQRCNLVGNQINWKSMNFDKSTFECLDSKIHGKKSVSFDNSFVEGRFRFNKTKVNSPAFSMVGCHMKGEDFSLQQSTFKGNLFALTKSVFETQRASLTRTHIDAEDVRFDYTRFENLQTSFQSLRADAERILFTSSLFASNRVAFNRTVFNARRTYFDNTNFGSGIVTFWRTDFGGGAEFNGAKDRGAIIHFNSDLSNVRWEGALMNRCRFHDSKWPTTGWMGRFCSSDEFPLIKRNNFSQLVEIYSWIASQYSDSNQDGLKRDFLFSAKEIDRRRLIQQKLMTPLIKMELRRWMTGYGLGLSHVGLIRGAAVFFTSLAPLFVKIR